MPAETGICRAAFDRYFFNSETCQCEVFIWGGCGGNANKFETLAECESAAEECDCECDGYIYMLDVQRM